MLITRKEKGSHWYTSQGEPCHEVVMPNGAKRPTNLRDARKMNLLRSVTNVMAIKSKPRIMRWQVEQAILASLTLPRNPNETLQEFAERVIADAEKQTDLAAEVGSRLHDLACAYLTEKIRPTDPTESVMMKPFCEWADANVKRVIFAEKVVVNHTLAYAGRLDAFVELKDETTAILDYKTRDIDLDKDGKAIPGEFYDEYPVQIAAYAACEDFQLRQAGGHKLISIIIGRNFPALQVKEWLPSATYFETFVHLCHVWSHFKKCTPGLKAAA